MDPIGLDGWRIDVGYPEDRDEAEWHFTEDTVNNMRKRNMTVKFDE